MKKRLWFLWLVAGIGLFVISGLPAAAGSAPRILFPVLLERSPYSIPQARPLISEVLANPLHAEPEEEWVEIVNPFIEAIRLDQYRVGEGRVSYEEDKSYLFPAGSRLEPGQVIVIAHLAVAFSYQYGFAPDYEIAESDPQVPNLTRYENWVGVDDSLRNEGDRIVIVDGVGKIVDGVNWGDRFSLFYPPVEKGKEGESIERFPPWLDTDRALDWRIQTSPSPGAVDWGTPVRTATAQITPTATESTPPVSGLVINEIFVNPLGGEGDANQDGFTDIEQDQFIELINNSGTVLDLEGWSVWDWMIKKHTFPQGTSLQPGCALVLFSGGNPSGQFGGSLVQTASTGSLNLNIDGDIVQIKGPAGELVLSTAFQADPDDRQSLVRFPEITGAEPFVLHRTVSAMAHSAGLTVAGEAFPGCK